ncbi:MAG: hypothetical protein ACUBOA_02135 [Candidatus Loosdrechtia sp.]|uniref:hypothetical protein n=1 Tax=Candidatus Loosdrechtia sp. TaxID=3101272 RepID=UPI003A6FEE42|nr:MAG: hypothetical protein QY305_08490 [Candidatus Jettenia sp. AMX2]
MFKPTKSLAVVFGTFFLFSAFSVKISFPDTFSIIREGIIRDLRGITRKQADVVKDWIDAKKRDIKVTAHNLHTYCGTTIQKNKEPDFSKPLEYLTYLKNIYHYNESNGYRRDLFN